MGLIASYCTDERNLLYETLQHCLKLSGEPWKLHYTKIAFLNQSEATSFIKKILDLKKWAIENISHKYIRK